MASAERIYGLLGRAPVIVSPPAPRSVREGGPGRAAFEHVWFAYTDERWIVSDCSFAVAPGEHVALVGTTGEGKSTCVRLLNRTWDVQRGRVLVDGIDVREWDLGRCAGTSASSSRIRSSSPARSRRIFRSTARPRRRLRWRALQTANAATLLERLPGGLGAISSSAPPISRTASVSCWPSRERSCTIPQSSCWTRRLPASTPSPSG